MVELFQMYSNLCDHNSPTLQTLCVVGRSRAGRTPLPSVTDRSDPTAHARHRCAIGLRSKVRPRLPR